MVLTITFVICALFLVLIVKAIIVRPGGTSAIPGPTFSFPILGHLPLLGPEPWVTFTKWKKVYGSLFTIKMGIYDAIVLNDVVLIKEAFSRPEFNGRPPFELFKTASQGKGIVFNDGPLVAEQRDFVQKSLRRFGFRRKNFEEHIRLELDQVLEDVDTKLGIQVVNKSMFAIPVLNAIWNMFMGQRFDHDDPQLDRIAEGIRKYGGVTYVTYEIKAFNYSSASTDNGTLDALSRFLPYISRLMPEFSGYNKKVGSFVAAYNIARKAFDEPLPLSRTFGSPQNFKEAFIDEMESNRDNLFSSFHPTHNFFQYSAGDIFLVSMETLSTTLDWLLVCMSKHPEEQKKLQAEIDEKIGTRRVPALSDKASTPYSEAVIEELLRFSSVAPLCGIMHRATEDTEFGGYRIKKDTLIIANTYGVHYEQDYWGDPENFRPERFLDENGTMNKKLKRRILPFGTRIRGCSGEKLARDQIYLYCASIFQRFSVSCDENTCIGTTTVGIMRAPKDFKLTFTKRSTD